MIGISNDFLRISVPRTVQESLDRQLAYAQQQQLASNWNPVAVSSAQQPLLNHCLVLGCKHLTNG